MLFALSPQTRIKFCGLVRLEDVCLAVQLGVDAIGLVFYPKSPRYLSLDEAKLLRSAIPSHVACVGLFVNQPPELIRQYRDTLGLDVLQFHGDETMVQIEACVGATPFWKALRVRPDDDLLELSAGFERADAFLLDAYSESFGGTGKRFDWSLAEALPASKVVLSGGLDHDTVAGGICRLQPRGVDVSSGIQADHPRAKSAQRMEQFVAAVRSADILKVKL
jgi:phosphoribosylanthranilate isomerase